MATSKVIGTVEVALDGVKIIGVDGSVRDAVYGASIYEGEQIISANPDALAQVKYVDLSESAAYEGVFRVLADGSVITGSDAMDSIVSDKNLSDIFQTAAGQGDVAESSGYFPSDVHAESSVLGFGRDPGGSFSSSSATNGEPDTDGNVRPVVGDVFLAQNEVLGVEGAGDLNIITGRLTAIDSLGDTHTFTMVPGTLSVTDTNGVITIADDSVTAVVNPDGTYTISGDFNDLSDGEVATVNFDYTATDQGGLTSAPATVAFTVTGTNDIPVVEAINVNGDNNHEFVLPDSDNTQGNVRTNSYSDGNDTHTLYETHDTTDVPGVDDTQDEGNNIYTAALSVADDDVMNTHEFRVVPDSVSIVDPAGSGLNADDISTAITFNETTQQWEYSIGGDFNKLAAGETATVTFQYVADDMRGFDGTDGINESSVSDPATITLTITGTNDQPIVDNINIVDALESHDNDAYQNGADDTQDDVFTSVSGTLIATDDDVTDTHIFHAVDMGPSYVEDSQPAFTIESVQPQISHTNYDGVDFYLNGESGTPTNMRVAVHSTAIDPTDIDVTKLVFTSNGGDDSSAGFSLQGNFNALGAGETATVTFKYYADDQNGFTSGDANNESSISELKTVNITITGTNDQPVVSDINVNGGTGENIGIPGVIVSTQEGEGDSVTVATGNIVQLNEGEQSGGSIDDWHFTHNGGPLTIDMLTESGWGGNYVDVNGDGIQSPLDSYIYLFRDTGSFDNSSYIAHNDDHGGGADGSVDGLDSYLNLPNLSAGDYVLVVGAFWLQEGDIQTGINLNNGGAGPYQITFTSTTPIAFPSSTQIVYETHDNDAYQNGADDTQDDVLTTFNANLATATDDDVNDTHTYQVVDHSLGVVAAPAGVDITDLGVNVNANTGDYTLTGNFNALAAGETATVTFQYQADDGQGFGANGDANNEASLSEPKTVTLTITGTNDQPVVADVQVDASESFGDNDRFTTINGNLGATDDDATDTHIFHAVGMHPVDDGPAFTIESVQPRISNINLDRVAYYENGESGNPTNHMRVLVQSDDINPHDINVRELVFTSNDGADSEAGFALKGNFNALGAGERATVTFQYYADDQNGFTSGDANNESSISELKTVTMTITGTNDQPVVSYAHFDTTEVDDGSQIFGGQLLLTRDADVNDTHTFEIRSTNDHTIAHGGHEADGTPNTLATVGTDDNGDPILAKVISDSTGLNDISLDSVTVDADGQFHVTGDFNALAAGETATVRFRYVAVDDSGVGTNPAVGESDTSASRMAEVTIMGTNDQPVVSNVHFDATEALNGAQTFDGQLSLTSDDDVSDGHTFEIRSTNDHTIAHGGYEADGTPNTLVNVGTDDNGNPILAKVISSSAGLDNISLDSVTVDSDGQFHVTGDFNALATGETATVRFRYVAVDDSGVGTNPAVGESDTSASRMAEVTIMGTNDAPFIIPGQTNLDFVSEGAGYDNVLGIYTIGADGNPTDPQIIMTDTNGGGDPAHTQLDLPFGSFGLFLIPNGDHVSGGIENAALSFDPNNPTQLLVNGEPTTAYYDNNAWNPGGLDHFDVATNNDGSVNISIEDLNLGDNDRNDLVVKLTPVDGSVGGTVVEIADGAPGENASFVSTDGTLAFDDLDLSDTHTSSITYTPDGDGYIGSFNASITTPATGAGVGEISWDFNVHDSLLDPMGPYDSKVQTYTVTVDDGHGGTATQDIVITIQGTNDAPVATADVITKVADHISMDDIPDDVSAMTYNSLFPWVTNDNAEVVLRPNGRYAVDDQNEVIGRHWSLVDDGDKPNFVDSEGKWNEGIIFNFNHNVDEATINLHNIDNNDRVAVAIYNDGNFIQFVDTSSITPNHQVLSIDEGVTFDEARIFALDTNHCNVTEFTVDSVVGNYEMDTVLPFVIDDNMLLANDSDVDGNHLQVQLDDTNLYHGTNVVGSVALNSDGDIVVTPDSIHEFDHDVDNAAHFNYSVVDEYGAQSAPATATIDVALGTVTGSDVSYDQQTAQEYIIGTDADTTPVALADNVLSVDTTLDLSHVSAINTLHLESGATVTGSGDTSSASSITASDVISATDTDNTLVINSSDGDASDQVSVDTSSLTPGADVNMDGMDYASYSDGDATLLIQIDDVVDGD